MRAVLDLDGVLTDFVTGVCWHFAIPNPYDDPKLHGVWNFIPHLGIDNFWHKLNVPFWANLDFMPDGLRILAVVESMIPKKDICILSTPSPENAAESGMGKILWIEKHLPGYKYLLGAPKDFCSHPETVLIDDADHNIEAFKGPSILVPRIWNAGRGVADPVDYVRRALQRATA